MHCRKDSIGYESLYPKYYMRQENVVERAWAQKRDQLSLVGCMPLDKLPNKSDLHFFMWKMWKCRIYIYNYLSTSISISTNIVLGEMWTLGVLDVGN